MKKTVFLITAFLLIGLGLDAQNKTSETKIKTLTYKEFLKKVWDFEKSPDTYAFKGKIPAVVDFYADWCGPCRKVGPIMEKLAKDYEGRLTVYKVNVDEQKDLAMAFQVRSIPMVLFLPLKGQPMAQTGAMSEQQYRNIIDNRLLNPAE